MKQVTSHIIARIRSFRKNAEGSLSVETVLIFPILLWVYIAMFVYFDVFREENTNLKAAYTVSDLLSRRLDGVDEAYIDGMNDIFDYLTNSTDPTWIRVSVIKWDDHNDEYKVDWSYATKSKPPHTDTTINTLAHKIPELPVGDSLIVVETTMTYKPMFNAGFGELQLENFVVTRPRFAPQLVWIGS